MKVLCNTEHHRLALWYALSLIPPLPRNLERTLHRLRPGIHGQHHLKPQHLRDRLRKLGEHIIIERPTGQRQTTRLLRQRLDEFWVAVPLVDGGVGGEEVEVVFAFGIPDGGA